MKNPTDCPRDRCPGPSAASVTATIVFQDFRVRVLVPRRLSSSRFILYYLAVSLRALLSGARARGGECGQANAPVDPFPLFEIFCYVEDFHAWQYATLAPLGQLPLSPAHVLCGRPCLATRQFVMFLFVGMRPQQSPDASIWPHIGTKSGGGFSTVSSHASSIELNSAYSRLRMAEVMKSAAMMSAPFLFVTFLSWHKSCFAMPRLCADVLLRCAERDVCTLSMWDHFFSLHATSLERILVESDEPISALVDVKLLRNNVLRFHESATLSLGVESRGKSPPRGLSLC